MKNIIKKAILGTLTSVLGLMALLICATSAIAGNSSPQNHGGPLVGLWETEVTVTNCQGVTLKTLEAYTTYHQDGTLNNTDTNGLTGPGSGTWKNLGGGSYSSTIRSFSFDANGINIGEGVITQTIQLAPDGMSSTGTATVEIFDVNGNLAALTDMQALQQRGSSTKNAVKRELGEPLRRARLLDGSLSRFGAIASLSVALAERRLAPSCPSAATPPRLQTSAHFLPALRSDPFGRHVVMRCLVRCCVIRIEPGFGKIPSRALHRDGRDF